MGMARRRRERDHWVIGRKGTSVGTIDGVNAREWARGFGADRRWGDAATASQVLPALTLFTTAAVSPVPIVANLFLLDHRGVVTGRAAAAALHQCGFAAKELSWASPFDRPVCRRPAAGRLCGPAGAAADEGEVTVAGELICKDGTRLPARVAIARLDGGRGGRRLRRCRRGYAAATACGPARASSAC